MANTIQCADCGTTREARNKNTRYCHHCRLLRNMEFFRKPHTHRECSSARCSAKYAPVERDDAYCGSCDLGYSTMRGTCKACSTADAYLIRPGVELCKECARDPKKRLVLIAALRDGQAKRKEGES